MSELRSIEVDFFRMLNRVVEPRIDGAAEHEKGRPDLEAGLVGRLLGGAGSRERDPDGSQRASSVRM